MNSSVHLFKYEEIGPEIFANFQNRTKDCIIGDVKIQKVKDIGFLYIQKNRSGATFMIQLTFVYFLCFV